MATDFITVKHKKTKKEYITTPYKYLKTTTFRDGNYDIVKGSIDDSPPLYKNSEGLLTAKKEPEIILEKKPIETVSEPIIIVTEKVEVVHTTEPVNSGTITSELTIDDTDNLFKSEEDNNETNRQGKRGPKPRI